MKFILLGSLEVCICDAGEGKWEKNRLSFFVIILKFPFTFSNMHRKSLEVVRHAFACKHSEASYSNIWSLKHTNLLAVYLNYFFTSCKLWLKLEMTFRDSTANDRKSICNIVSGFMFPKDLVNFSLPCLCSFGDQQSRGHFVCFTSLMTMLCQTCVCKIHHSSLKTNCVM